MTKQHNQDCDVNDRNPDGIQKPCNCEHAASNALLAFVEAQYCATIQIMFTLQTLLPSTADGIDLKRRLGVHAEAVMQATSEVRQANTRISGAKRSDHAAVG